MKKKTCQENLEESSSDNRKKKPGNLVLCGCQRTLADQVRRNSQRVAYKTVGDWEGRTAITTNVKTLIDRGVYTSIHNDNADTTTTTTTTMTRLDINESVCASLGTSFNPDAP